MSVATIQIAATRPRIEEIFAPYRKALGDDYPGYRNHVYRTVTYAMHFIGEDEVAEGAVETAMVYHDIGLWTDRAPAYLEPSEALALADNEKFGWGFDPELLRGIIHWHHKLTAYRGPHERVIEACRKPDWIDATMGTVRKGMSRANIKAVEEAFPNAGFHKALLRLPKDLTGSTLVGGARVTVGIVEW